MTTDHDLITEGRAVDAALTSGPWFACVNDVIGGRCIQTVDVPASAAPPGSSVLDMVFHDADADRIVWMRNNFGALLAELGLMRTIANELDEAQDEANTRLAAINGEHQRHLAAIAAKQRQYRARIEAEEHRAGEMARLAIAAQETLRRAREFAEAEMDDLKHHRKVVGVDRDGNPEFQYSHDSARYEVLGEVLKMLAQ